MNKLRFKYSMKIIYSSLVDSCHFTIKCLPANTDRQEIEEINIEINPEAKYSYSEDGFGNKKLIGSTSGQHERFCLLITGCVKIKQIMYESVYRDENIGIYKYPYGKTIPGKKLINYTNMLCSEMLNRRISNAYDKAIFIMRRLNKDFDYFPEVTNVETTAEEAFAIGKGVCQDYAHIYIAILRQIKVPARYVAGLMIGEGKSHAWVELLLRKKWIGFDPTNCLTVDDNYIKLAHGRDAGDCKINLGIIRGGGSQIQGIDVKVWKE